jgi:hypothetical protein
MPARLEPAFHCPFSVEFRFEERLRFLANDCLFSIANFGVGFGIQDDVPAFL